MGLSVEITIALAGANYLEVLEKHMLPIWDIHQCHHFMHDGAPAHMSKFVKRLLESGKYQFGSGKFFTFKTD